jgi:hypothetical protein
MSNLTGRPVAPKGQRKKKRRDNDAAYCKWIQTQPSALSGGRPAVAAHYRTAANSGTGCKPLFCCIPLLDEEHREQHRIGQFNFKPREWWEEAVAFYQERFIAEGGEIPLKYQIITF